VSISFNYLIEKGKKMDFEKEIIKMIEDTKKEMRDILGDKKIPDFLQDDDNNNRIGYVVLERQLAVLLIVLGKYKVSIANLPKF
jgi:hypothetical protein